MIFPQVMTSEDIFTALHSLAFGTLARVNSGKEQVLAYDKMMQKLRLAKRSAALDIVKAYVATRGYMVVERVVTWDAFCSMRSTALIVTDSGYAIVTDSGQVYKNKKFDVFGALMFPMLEIVEVCDALSS